MIKKIFTKIKKLKGTTVYIDSGKSAIYRKLSENEN